MPEYQSEKYLGEQEQQYLSSLLQKEESGEEMTVEESSDLFFLLTKSRPEPGEGRGMPVHNQKAGVSNGEASAESYHMRYWEHTKKAREHEANRRARVLLEQVGEDVQHQTQGVPELLQWAIDHGVFVRNPIRMTQIDAMTTLEQILGAIPSRVTWLMDQAGVHVDAMDTPENAAYHVAQEVLLYLESTLPPL